MLRLLLSGSSSSHQQLSFSGLSVVLPAVPMLSSGWQGCVGCSQRSFEPHSTVTLPVKLPEQAAVQDDVFTQLAGQEGMPGRGRGGEEHTARAAAAAATDRLCQTLQL
jgi:hypothetical protein